MDPCNNVLIGQDMRLYASKGGCQFEVKDGSSQILKFKKLKSKNNLKYAGKKNTAMCRNPGIIGKKIVTDKTTARHKSGDTMRGHKSGYTMRGAHRLLSRICKIVDLIQLADGIYLLSYEHPRNQHKTVISSTWEPEETSVPSMQINNMAVIKMCRAKLCVIGTRVFCYESGSASNPPSNTIAIVDIWNPMSVYGDEKYLQIHYSKIPPLPASKVYNCQEAPRTGPGRAVLRFP